jgi:dipeptidyl aminopeptidase/acylaminoacyl peptidase
MLVLTVCGLGSALLIAWSARQTRGSSAPSGAVPFTALAAVAGPAPPVPTAAPTVLTDEAQQRDRARVALAASVVDAMTNWNNSSLVARWSPDGKSILFGSRRDGNKELYLADPRKPWAPPRALTSGPERAPWGAFADDSIVFLRDHGADEDFAIWRVKLDASGLVNLTPGDPMHRDEPFVPLHASRALMLYSAAKVSERSSYLFAQDVTGGTPRLIYSQPLPGGAFDAAPDGTRVLFTEARADDDVITREIDVATGAARRIYPPAGRKAGVRNVIYSANGSAVFVATTADDRAVLLAIDPSTGKETARYFDPLPSAALDPVVSPAGDVLAVGVDAGNHGEVRILDAHTLRLKRSIKLPLGDIRVGTFRGDGRLFSLMISLPNQPPDVFAVEPATAQLTPLRQDPRPTLKTLPAISVSLQSVRAFDGLEIPLNVYLPNHDADAKLPVIVVFHGGPASNAAVRWNPWIRFFSALGYGVLEPNVRGSSGFGRAYEMADNREKRADWLRDIASVNEWVRSQRWADPERIVALGGSYGGYSTLMALTRQPTAWRAGVDLVGPADLKQFLLTTDAAIRSLFVAEFGDVEKDAALLEQFSPMRDVDKIERPLFVYAGQNDPRVPRRESDRIVTALRRRGITVEYMVAPNEGHTLDRRDTTIEFLTRAARFLEDALREPVPAGKEQTGRSTAVQ